MTKYSCGNKFTLTFGALHTKVTGHVKVLGMVCHQPRLNKFIADWALHLAVGVQVEAPDSLRPTLLGLWTWGSGGRGAGGSHWKREGGFNWKGEGVRHCRREGGYHFRGWVCRRKGVCLYRRGGCWPWGEFSSHWRLLEVWG